MSKDYRVYLNDILECIKKIEKYTKNMGESNFLENDLVKDGVIRNLEIIGEASKNLPEFIKIENNEIEWKKICGLRDILIHAYSEMDIKRVWEVVKEKIPTLKNKIKKIIKEWQFALQ